MKDKLTRWLIPLVGEGLLTSEGDFWRRQRRLTQPTFQRQQIERYAAVMVEHIERMLEAWHDGEVRDPHDDMAHLTLSIVAKTLFETDLTGEADVVGESLEVVINHFMSPMRWFRFFDYLPLPSSRRYWRAIRLIDNIIYGIESMRLYPPAWNIAREALADCEIGGYHVPKGTQIFMVQRLVHRDGRWFDEPDIFKPERWNNDLIKRLPRCAYFPFGDGPRICIGNHFAMMEAVLLLATIARRFRLEIEPGQTLALLPSITLRPRHPIHVRLRANQRAVTQSPDTSRMPVSQVPTT
jgi:cytochrome P450